MRKYGFLVVLSILFAALLVGCGANNGQGTGNTGESAPPEQETSNEEKNNFKILMGVQMDMIRTIRADIQPLLAYERGAEGASLEEAKTAANTVAQNLRNTEISSDLDDRVKGELEESVELFAQYFEARGDDLQVDDEEKVQYERLEAFHEQIGDVFEEEGLIRPNFDKDVQ
ncbi:hypothetical protein [Bacillus sp. FJAT-45066]|uniref:hypothetical protein n=1 Tax=Bacillus sp. FJAT-45066 TaxID=2011010 RepID=UPI000BB72D88|nr:hypothetical protein [Bacillus sp. FJAT-45066]